MKHVTGLAITFPLLLVTFISSAYAATDFSISASPDTVEIAAGSTGQFTITISSLDGFNSAVTLDQLAAAGFVTSFSPNPVTPPSGGSVTSLATISVSGLVTPNAYTLTIVGASGSTSHSTTITVVVTNGSPPPSAKTQLTVRTYDGKTNNEILGYYAVLYRGGYDLVASGFSPTTFTLDSGEDYIIQVQDYDRNVFWFWGDTNSGRDRVISITRDTEVNAFYRNIDSPPESGQSKISVSTADMSSNTITGYYTTIWQAGVELQSGFSPYSFFVSNSQTYQVTVADYGNYMFDHWSDGTTDRYRTITAGTGTTTGLTAVYRQTQ